MSRAGANPWLVVRDAGDTLRIRTSDEYVRRRRVRFRALSAGVALAGVALAAYSPWLLVLAALGVIGVALAPRLFGPADLVEVDRARDLLTSLQPAAGRGRSVAASRLRAIRGVYEVYGWDPRSTIYAVLDGGERVPILVFAGTDEALAEEACRLLGRLANAEASYEGPYGTPKACFTPSEDVDAAAG